MKKLFVVLFIFSFVYFNVQACTIIPISFCETFSTFEDRLIVEGTITDVDEFGINFEILQVLNGTEDRQNIRIWDGQDFDCNGIFSMAASDFGNVGDKRILILPKIDSLISSWDVIGDYRRPDNYHYSPILYINDDIVTGFIAGYAQAPESYNLYSYDYDNFIEDWNEVMNCEIIVPVKSEELEKKIRIVPNPNRGIFTIESEFQSNDLVLIFMDYLGNEFDRKSAVKFPVYVRFEDLHPGFYYIRVVSHGVMANKKFIIQTY